MLDVAFGSATTPDALPLPPKNTKPLIAPPAYMPRAGHCVTSVSLLKPVASSVLPKAIMRLSVCRGGAICMLRQYPPAQARGGRDSDADPPEAQRRRHLSRYSQSCPRRKSLHKCRCSCRLTDRRYKPPTAVVIEFASRSRWRVVVRRLQVTSVSAHHCERQSGRKHGLKVAGGTVAVVFSALVTLIPAGSRSGLRAGSGESGVSGGVGAAITCTGRQFCRHQPA